MTLHCESCGQENPGTDDGYTTCCNELTCDGRFTDRWVTGPSYDTREETGGTVNACCSSAAEALLKGTGLVVLYRAAR